MKRLWCITKKVVHKTRKQAWSASLYQFIHFGFMAYAYKCKFCKYYHLTTHPYDKNPQVSKEFKEGFNEWYGSEVIK